MKARWFAIAALGLAFFTVVWFAIAPSLPTAKAGAEEGKIKMLAHHVYFSLNEPTDANRQKLVDACQKYLAGEPGTIFFAVGTPSDLDRAVNDRDFDVALHVVFKDRAAHDAYQTADKHVKFIEENKPSWKKVRVFDSDVVGAK